MSTWTPGDWGEFLFWVFLFILAVFVLASKSGKDKS